MWCARLRRGEAGRSTLRRFLLVWRACSPLIFCLWAPELLAQPTPAGTRIVNSAQVTFQASDGLTYTVGSNADVMIVGQVGGVDVDPPRASVADPGETATFAHTLKNLGNGTDSFTVVGRSKAGWPVRVLRDVNGNGVVDAGDALASAPIRLPSGASVALLLQTDVPPVNALRGTTDTITVVGTSAFDPSVTDRVTDQLQIRGVGIVVVLTNAVDRSSATVGEILTYTVTYVATGVSSATDFKLLDPIPLGATYVQGTLRLNGANLTDGVGDDAGFFDAVANRVVVVLATLSGGESGTVTFQVRVGR